MLSHYNDTLNALRKDYDNLGWLQWFFPRQMAVVLKDKTLPPLEENNGLSRSYTAVEAGRILAAFTKINWFFILVFRCLRVFKASRLLENYYKNKQNVSFIDDDTPIVPDITAVSVLSEPGIEHATSLSSPPTPIVDLAAIADGTDRMSVLNDDLFKREIHSIGAYLAIRDKVQVSNISRHFYGLFRPSLLFPSLFKWVMRGHIGALSFFKRFPELLIKKGDVTDDSGRTFHHVSPWEYMLWAMDTRYMGQRMLNCIPKSVEGDAIRRQCLAQYEAMQRGGRDLVKMDRNPTHMSVDELHTFLASLRADNKDMLLYHWDATDGEEAFYYYTNDIVERFKYEPGDRNPEFIALFNLMAINSAKKSNDAEHELIRQATGKCLSRKGIHYEQPATYKSLVKLGNTGDPRTLAFEDIAVFFDTPDAVLYGNNQFYYANKSDFTVTEIEPAQELSSQERNSLNRLKNMFYSMNCRSMLPPTLEAHQSLNHLFRAYPAFQPTHHCETHYDFRVIDALEFYLNHYETGDLGWHRSLKNYRDALWNKAMKAQREAPAHVLQHYCDPERTLGEPVPDFKAAQFERRGEVYNKGTYKYFQLFSAVKPLDSDFGFEFGLQRGYGEAAMTCSSYIFDMYARPDLAGLRKLCEVRTADAALLHKRLCQPIVPAEANQLNHSEVYRM